MPRSRWDCLLNWYMVLYVVAFTESLIMLYHSIPVSVHRSIYVTLRYVNGVLTGCFSDISLPQILSFIDLSSRHCKYIIFHRRCPLVICQCHMVSQKLNGFDWSFAILICHRYCPSLIHHRRESVSYGVLTVDFLWTSVSHRYCPALFFQHASTHAHTQMSVKYNTLYFHHIQYTGIYIFIVSALVD